MPIRSSDPIRCAEAIIDRAGRDIALAMPIGVGKPVALVNALYRVAKADRSIRLRIFTGLSLVRPAYRTSLERRFVEPLLERTCGSYPDLDYTRDLRAGGLPANIEVTEFFLQAGAWLSNARVQRSYTSLNYSQVAKHLERTGTNVLGQLVAPKPQGEPRISLSSNTDITLDMVPYILRRRQAGQPLALAVEINANLPYMPGAAEMDVSECDVVLEAESPHYDLFAPPKEPVSLADYAMALHAATLIKDGGTLQIGIGSFSDALTHALILRTRAMPTSGLCSASWARRCRRMRSATGPFAIGLYGCTEMLVDGFLALLRAGILRRRVTGADGREAVLHAGFFVGNQAFYRELREMPREVLDLVAMTAISFTNTLDGDAEAKRAQRATPASSTPPWWRPCSAPCPPTSWTTAASSAAPAASTTSSASPTRWRAPAPSSACAARGDRTGAPPPTSSGATPTRRCRGSCATSSSPSTGSPTCVASRDRDVVAAMLGVADSSFQPGLIDQARHAGKLESSFKLPNAGFNRAERIEAALAPARRDGLLPAFPLGTEMTEVEQTLAGRLTFLKSAGYADLIGTLVAGLARTPASPQENAALARLGLHSPGSLRTAPCARWFSVRCGEADCDRRWATRFRPLTSVAGRRTGALRPSETRRVCPSTDLAPSTLCDHRMPEPCGPHRYSDEAQVRKRASGEGGN